MLPNNFCPFVPSSDVANEYLTQYGLVTNMNHKYPPLFVLDTSATALWMEMEFAN